MRWIPFSVTAPKNQKQLTKLVCTLAFGMSDHKKHTSKSSVVHFTSKSTVVHFWTQLVLWNTIIDLLTYALYNCLRGFTQKYYKYSKGAEFSLLFKYLVKYCSDLQICRLDVSCTNTSLTVFFCSTRAWIMTLSFYTLMLH